MIPTLGSGAETPLLGLLEHQPGRNTHRDDVSIDITKKKKQYVGRAFDSQFQVTVYG